MVSGEYTVLGSWSAAPWVSRTIAVLHLIGMSIAWVMADVMKYNDTPEVLAVWSINSGNIGCLFLAPWMSWDAGGQHEVSLFLSLLASITILNRLPQFERRYGSGTCLTLTIACLMAINGIFIGVMEAACLSSGLSYDPYFGCNQYLWGLWPLAMFIVTRQCLDHPRGKVDFWGAWQIPNIWYPLCLILLLSAAQMRVVWDCLCGVSLALILRLVIKLASTRMCGGVCRYCMLRCCPSWYRYLSRRHGKRAEDEHARDTLDEIVYSV
ncbi:hypothetical protein Pmar_PMAR015657 [Perkinsus marinus ATCC 50983]|uniref:Uncharacterized protein n=1 Tax=Perkinsus marinus (strain ATCC 50983 / TXsc) TaxID=423536 RepID=C5K4A0_PERM5|nr:hypothetical protein Pmar_PMAR015657 [Perkinsus marinus ATCC 50983]EER20716.1 hypothetical protein Pmar_PMAR015657 [Perkinsus marinus ATCC 50983]|eukprot:XP_002788920.1 hypothetical protein Pmar_PMAR015657 [Perkinsus marinus ATCC 50983]